MKPSLDVVIVNWNTGRQLEECLASLAAVNREGFELDRVIVVDNASSDRSAEEIDKYGLPLEMVRNKENLGFAVACNQAARNSRTKYLLFLNPDTRLFADSLSKPLELMEHPKYEKIGICGIQLLNDLGQVSRSCVRFPLAHHFVRKMLGLDRLFPDKIQSYIMREWDHAQNRKVDHVCGAFYLVRRELFESLKGFDERFFVYLEDLDFSYRASKLGWSSYYFAETKCFHKGGGTSEPIDARRLFYSLRSRILYGNKHFDRWKGVGLALGVMSLEFVVRLGLSLSQFSFRRLTETIKGYILLWGVLPHLLIKGEK